MAGTRSNARHALGVQPPRASVTVVIDSGGLSAIAEETEAARAVIRWAVRTRSDVVIPTVVIAESTTGSGPRDARVNAAIARSRVAPLTEDRARLAARLRHQADSAATIDAIVAAEAVAAPGRAVIVTAERGRTDFAPLVDGHTSVVVTSV